jgi:hypothetical protein
MADLDDVKRLAEDHDQQVDQGVEKAGDAAESRFGHGEQIDQAVDKVQDATGSGDQNN